MARTMNEWPYHPDIVRRHQRKNPCTPLVSDEISSSIKRGK